MESLFLSCVLFDLHRGASERPELSGPEEVVVSDDGWFEIHFTREGKDAPSGPELEGGLPEAVESILDGLDMGKAAFEEAGWRALVRDDGAGGSDAIDIYVRSLDANGYATPVPTSDGSHSCYMQIDGSLGTLGYITESVAIHELHHCVEYRYSVDVAPWFYESAATHAQYAHLLDPALELALGVLWADRLAGSDRPMNNRDGRFEYSGFLVSKFWADREPSANPLPELWEALAGEPDWEAAMDTEAARRWDETLPEAVLELATWNAFACAADDGQHYDDQVLPCIADVTVPFVEWEDGPLEFSHEEGPYTAAYGRIEGDGDGLEVTCAGEGRFRIVAVDRDGRRAGHADGADGLAWQPVVEAGGFAWLVATSDGPPLDLVCDVVRVPAPVVDPLPACGCISTRTGPVGLWFGLVVLLGLRRR